ncbi:MAG: DUF4251 domain-containing protein [Paludibacteraceae bacterium]
MKRIENYFIIVAIFSAFIACGTSQNIVENSLLKKRIENRNYTFKANYVTPSSTYFQSRHLTSGYTLRIAPDSVIAYLPYFGRAYQAPMDTGEGGIKFVSTKFVYDLNVVTKNNSWLINIRTKDTMQPINLRLDVYNDGTATLYVADPSRQPISYRGEIE